MAEVVKEAQAGPHFGWALHLLKYALPMVRPFLKMDGTESAAWDVVTGIVTSIGPSDTGGFQ